MRIRQSHKFVEQLRASLIELPPIEPEAAPLAAVVTGEDPWVYDALRERVARLRLLALPRTEVPTRLGRSRWAQLPVVRPLLLRLTNIATRRSQLQAALVADCVDLLTLEMRRARGFD